MQVIRGHLPPGLPPCRGGQGHDGSLGHLGSPQPRRGSPSSSPSAPSGERLPPGGAPPQHLRPGALRGPERGPLPDGPRGAHSCGMTPGTLRASAFLDHRGWLDREVLEARTWKEISPLHGAVRLGPHPGGGGGRPNFRAHPRDLRLGEAMRFVYPALLLLALMGGLLLAFPAAALEPPGPPKFADWWTCRVPVAGTPRRSPPPSTTSPRTCRNAWTPAAWRRPTPCWPASCGPCGCCGGSREEINAFGEGR